MERPCRIAIVGISAAITWSGAIPGFHGFDLLALAATLVGGYPVFEEAISTLLARRMTMELSMTIARRRARGRADERCHQKDDYDSPIRIARGVGHCCSPA